jgi:tape measure domain-containing protein
MANRVVQAVYDLVDNVSGKLRNIVDALSGHAKQSDQTTSKVEANNKRVSQSYAQSAEGIGKLKEALVAIAAFAGLEKIKDGLEDVIDAGEKFDDLKKRFATAFGGLEEGEKTLAQVRDLAKTVPNSFEDVADAAIALKRAGIDPLDGSLQALLDNAAANNQSQEQLIKTIEDLGKSAVKGQVNIKALVALTEDGIPVFDLLGQSMGVSSDRVRELASSGQLGADAIKLLITQLGKLRAGAAADELGDFDSQMVKLKDSAREFLEEIASSGALQVFRDGIKELNAEVEEAAKSGKLKEIAQGVSDAIVATANAVKGVIGFVVDYSSELKRLIQVYLTFKGVEIASSILQTSAAFQASAIGMRAAAAEAGAATGIFGKLGGLLRSIKGNIIITVAVLAAETALEVLGKIVAFRQEEVHLDRLVREGDVATTAGKQKLAAAIEDVKAKTQQYADVALKSGEELQQQSAAQLKGYLDQLNGARTYFNALTVKAQATNDALLLKGAQEHLDAVNAEIVKVNGQLSITQIAGQGIAKGLTAGAAAMVAKLSELGTDAKATSDVIQKTFQDFDLKQPTQEVGDFAVAFDTIAAKGGKASDILNATLLESLKKLDGQSLLNFQSSSIAAIDSLGKDAEKNSGILKATLEAALDRLGVKAEATGQSVTKAGADIIATFEAVAENSQANSKTIAAAFEASINTAKTVEEIKTLRAELDAAAAAGKVAFQDMAAATRDFDERLRTVQASLSPLTDQFQLLGIKSQAQLNAVRDNAKEAFYAIVDGARNGTAAQEDVVRAFKAYVDAARAAAADSSQTNKDQVEEQLAVLASVLNVTDAFTKAGDAGKKAGTDTKDAFGNATDAIDQAADSVDAFGNRITSAANNAAGVGTASQKSAKQTQDAFGGIVAIGADAERAFSLMNDQLTRTGTLADVSLDEAKFLLTNLGGLAGAQTQVLVDRINELEQAAEKTRQVAEQMANEASDLQDQIDQLQGNDSAIEDRRHQQKLADLKAEAEANNTISTAAYRNLIALEDKLHDLKLANIKSEADASAKNKANSSGTSKPTANGAANDDSNTPAKSGGASATLAPSYTVNIQGPIIGVGLTEEQFARNIKKQLDAIAVRSR